MKTRIKSFLWRTGMMIIGFVITAMINNISTLELQPATATLLGLFLGELSKALNNYLSGKY